MNVVLIVPTGIGCEIGGHAGDANPVAKLIGKCCDKLITHPNVVNASDINEMPENTLYVEGGILDRFLRRDFNLQEVYYNKILLAVNKPVNADTVNAMNAARMTIGADIELLELDEELSMKGYFMDGKATGRVRGVDALVDQVQTYAADHNFDALAIQSEIHVDKKSKIEYLKGDGGVNPWGGVEAMASKLISKKLEIPVAHSPFSDWKDESDDLYGFREIVDPRMSAEMVSVTYLHCILKGLHKAPRINRNAQGLSVDDIDFLITPIDCVGPPHWACMDAGIPIIAVRENKNVLKNPMPDEFIIVDNYLEAAGVLMAHRSGIHYKSVRRK